MEMLKTNPEEIKALPAKALVRGDTSLDLPLLEPLPVAAGDRLDLKVESETGGGESGIAVRWTVQHLRHDGSAVEQSLSIDAGFLS